MECWFSQFKCGDQNSNEYRKRLIDSFVNSVYVFDDKLVLTFNYQHGTQTVSLAEIEASFGSDLEGSSPPKTLHRQTVCAVYFCCDPLYSLLFSLGKIWSWAAADLCAP